MLRPDIVADCVARMREAVQVPLTVKCRIGIDARDDYEFFAEFVDRVVRAGVDALIVHARAAILGGLSPKENREIPPLRYDYAYRLKRERPSLPLILNGGLLDADSALAHLSPPGGLPLGLSAQADRLDGVMLGRAAYHQPSVLAKIECAVIDPLWSPPAPEAVIERMVSYARSQCRHGVRLHSISRHMHGLVVGREGARAWRRFLSEVAARPEAGPDTLYAALPLLRIPRAA
jgi:tRNA-dihydrouridine synthase A